MATIKLEGFGDYERILRELQNESEDIIKSGVYEGAKIVAMQSGHKSPESAQKDHLNTKQSGVKSKNKP